MEDVRLAYEESDDEKMEEIRARVDAVVEDPDTAAALKPWYRQLCKRPCFHDEYLQAFNRDNVHLVDTDGKGVTRIDATGCWVGDTHFTIDVLVIASGFEVGTDIGRRCGFETVGRDGITLSERWADGMSSLHGMHVTGFPNLFVVGPQQQANLISNITHNQVEAARTIAAILSAAREHGATRVEVTPEAEAAWTTLMAEAEQGILGSTDCTPGYYNNEGGPVEWHNDSMPAAIQRERPPISAISSTGAPPAISRASSFAEATSPHKRHRALDRPRPWPWPSPLWSASAGWGGGADAAQGLVQWSSPPSARPAEDRLPQLFVTSHRQGWRSGPGSVGSESIQFVVEPTVLPEADVTSVVEEEPVGSGEYGPRSRIVGRLHLDCLRHSDGKNGITACQQRPQPARRRRRCRPRQRVQPALHLTSRGTSRWWTGAGTSRRRSPTWSARPMGPCRSPGRREGGWVARCRASGSTRPIPALKPSSARGGRSRRRRAAASDASMSSAPMMGSWRPVTSTSGWSSRSTWTVVW